MPSIMNLASPQHYAIVGGSILTAIKDVLGEAATEPIVAGWADGYWFLANLLIGIEEKKMADREKQKGTYYFLPLRNNIPNKILGQSG